MMPRTTRGNAKRHDLHDMLAISLLSMLTGGRTCVDMEDYGCATESWLRTFLGLEHGIPSHDTFSRLLGKLDPAGLQQFRQRRDLVRLAVHHHLRQRQLRLRSERLQQVRRRPLRGRLKRPPQHLAVHRHHVAEPVRPVLHQAQQRLLEGLRTTFPPYPSTSRQ